MTKENLENKIGFQIGFLLHSGKSINETIKLLTEIANDYAVEKSKHYVKEALNQASEKADLSKDNSNDLIDKDSILSAYPLENIK